MQSPGIHLLMKNNRCSRIPMPPCWPEPIAFLTLWVAAMAGILVSIPSARDYVAARPQIVANLENRGFAKADSSLAQGADTNFPGADLTEKASVPDARPQAGKSTSVDLPPGPTPARS
jgi:hypothetical protein